MAEAVTLASVVPVGSHRLSRQVNRTCSPWSQGEANWEHRLLPEVSQQLVGGKRGHCRRLLKNRVGQDGERQGLLWAGDQAQGPPVRKASECALWCPSPLPGHGCDQESCSLA